MTIRVGVLGFGGLGQAAAKVLEAKEITYLTGCSVTPGLLAAAIAAQSYAEIH